MTDTNRKQIVIPSNVMNELREVAKEDGHDNTSVAIRQAIKFWLHHRGRDVDITVTVGNPKLIEEHKS